ncbi:MAG: ATP-binding protein [Desulfomicrobium apsheronum]|nr:ATP-binding protein [Desulfomicrobium apsheronum]
MSIRRYPDNFSTSRHSMHDSPFENMSETAQHFSTPQLEDIFQSVLSDIQNHRLLSCVIGFPKSGKTFFLNRLKSAQSAHTLSITASSGLTLSQTINENLSPEKENKAALTQLLREKKHVILFVDNAHLLTDADFAFLGGLFSLTKHLTTVLQVVLVGNGEIVHRLARPENRPIYNMLGAIWTLPKLTREQSLAYIRFLLDGAGLATDLIGNPEAVAKRAAGVIGILRMLTMTLALKALHSDQSCDAEEALNFKSNCPEAQAQAPDEAMPTQNMASGNSWMAGVVLALSMAAIIGTFLFFFSWLMPEARLGDLFHDFTGTPRETNVEPAPSAPVRQQDIHTASGPVHWQSVAKTVFRKRTTDGPYSLQLGAYPTMESLLLHLPRFMDQKQPLFWNQDQSGEAPFTLFVGRFESFEQAGRFASQNSLSDTPVVFRPFVATVGPLTDQQQIDRASMSLGLPEQLNIFERELVSGIEIQFALERSRDDALAHCTRAEKKGLSCAVTQYE